MPPDPPNDIPRATQRKAARHGPSPEARGRTQDPHDRRARGACLHALEILTSDRPGSVAYRACTSTSGCMCTESSCPCARARAPYVAARVAVHQSHAGRPNGEPERARPGLGRRCRTALRPGGRATGPPAPRSGARHPSGRDCWLGVTRSGGGDGAVRLHPPWRQSRFAEMGGHSQPRPRSADWRRRSAGRGATASAPATWTTGAVSGRTASSCPATPKVSRTRRTCHQHLHPAVKTGPPTDGSNAITGRTLEVETSSGYAFASATTLVADSAADMRAVSTGGAALMHHDAPSRREGEAPPSATSTGARPAGDRRGGRATPRRPLGYTRGKLAHDQ